MDNERNYKVGRGKPPVHSQFKKGQSGNPDGAQKHKTKRNRRGFGVRDFAIILGNEKLPVTVRGKLRQMLMKEAMIRRVFMDFMECTPNVRARLFPLVVQMGVFDFEPRHFQSRHEEINEFLDKLKSEMEAREKDD